MDFTTAASWRQWRWWVQALCHLCRMLFTSTGPSHSPTWLRSPRRGWSSCPTSSLAAWPSTLRRRSWGVQDRLEQRRSRDSVKYVNELIEKSVYSKTCPHDIKNLCLMFHSGNKPFTQKTLWPVKHWCDSLLKPEVHLDYACWLLGFWLMAIPKRNSHC